MANLGFNRKKSTIRDKGFLYAFKLKSSGRFIFYFKYLLLRFVLWVWKI